MKKFLLAIIAIGLIIAGCAKTKSETENVKKQPDIPSVKLTYSKDLSVAPEKFWIDNELPRVFANYWGTRFAKKSTQAFELEAPYFQEMANFERYASFIEAAISDQVNEIELRDKTQLSERLLKLNCIIRLKNKDGIIKEIPIIDQWVYVGQKWYHVWRDRLIFPNES